VALDSEIGRGRRIAEGGGGKFKNPYKNGVVPH